jgi:signal transduction histidine kinase
VRIRHRQAAALRELTAQLEREQEARTRAAAAGERARIARELHDVISHSVSLIAVQAGAAGRVIDAQPAAARDALGTIERTARDTLGELRRLLGILREHEGGAELASPPGSAASASFSSRPEPPACPSTSASTGRSDR